MQLVIALNEIDPEHRFLGARKVELANNATLYLDGEYDGLYSHVERLDKVFPQRVYGKADGADEGDLWKSGSAIRTIEETYSEDRIDALWRASSAAETCRPQP